MVASLALLNAQRGSTGQPSTNSLGAKPSMCVHLCPALWARRDPAEIQADSKPCRGNSASTRDEQAPWGGTITRETARPDFASSCRMRAVACCSSAPMASIE